VFEGSSGKKAFVAFGPVMSCPDAFCALAGTSTIMAGSATAHEVRKNSS
jgi:hypothetical protein